MTELARALLGIRGSHRDAILVAGAAGVAVWVRVARSGDPGGLIVRAYLVGVAALALLLLLGWLGRAHPAPRAPAWLPRRRRRRRRPGRLPELEAMESALELGQLDGMEFDRRLRRELREIAADRLAIGHGIDLDRQRERAAALLGEDLDDLVRPDRPRARRDQRGPERVRLRNAAETLERL
ncbi:MAG: hypothetical protein ACREPA_06765 [Candidatus Dormibacteraceae bacterium]